jgi:hypothetical protein
VCLGEYVERFLHLVVDDPSRIDVEPGEERLVQDGTDCLVPPLIGSLRRFQQRQRVPEDRAVAVEVAVGVGQGVFDLAAPGPDGVDPDSVSHNVNVTLLLRGMARAAHSSLVPFLLARKLDLGTVIVTRYGSDPCTSPQARQAGAIFGA